MSSLTNPDVVAPRRAGTVDKSNHKNLWEKVKEMPTKAKIRVGMYIGLGLALAGCIAAKTPEAYTVIFTTPQTPRVAPTPFPSPTDLPAALPIESTNTPKPVDTATPRPANTATAPKPSDTPKPVDTATAPKPTDTPKPVDTATAPKPTDTPKPVDTATAPKPSDTPKPVDTATAPKPSDTPKPVDTATAPKPTDTPKPVDTATAPKPSDTPKPVDTATAPKPTDTPKPVDTATPSPTQVALEINVNKENLNKALAIDVVKQTINESKRPITTVRSGYSISGTSYSLDFWSLNEGTPPLYAKIDPKYNDPNKNAIGFKALRTLVPNKATIRDIVAFRGLFENSSSIGEAIKQKLLDKGWRDVSIATRPDYFKLQSQNDPNGNSTILVWDSRGLGPNLSYYQENPYGAIYNTADNPVSLNSMTLSDVITMLGGGLEGEQAQKIVALFLKP